MTVFAGVLIVGGCVIATMVAVIVKLYLILKDERRYLEKVCTDQGTLNAELFESDHRFKCFYENAFEGLAITRNRKILDCNHQLAAMFGYTREEVIGQPVTLLVLKDDHEKVERNMAEGYSRPYQHRSVSKNGAIGTVEVCGQETQYNGQTVRVTAVHDVSAQINAAILLSQVEANEHQTSKMEAIGNFAAGIAHDFNNILSPIIGYAGVLLLEIEAPAQKKSIREILKAADLASQLVHRIQSFAKIDYLPMLKPINVPNVVNETVAFLRSMIPASVEIELNMQQPLCTILAAEITLKQILMNLCKNSAQSMPDQSGRIVITILCDEGPTGSYLRLIVADNGAGMSAQTLTQAKDPYFTTKKEGKNSGLGLTVVHGIVESYNADMQISSEQGEGTIITIDIPAATKEQIKGVLNAVNADDLSPVLLGSGQHVLFVDDEQYMCDLVVSILTSLNYTVTAFNSSLDAWDEFRTNPQKYDVVISDVTMPSMTGIQLIQNIKALDSEVKTILCSGLGSNYQTERVVAASDIDAYITKPCGRDKFARVLTELIAE